MSSISADIYALLLGLKVYFDITKGHNSFSEKNGE